MADVKHFKAVDKVVQSFLPLLGNGLLLADEATWRHHRSILQPAFFAEKLKVAQTLCI
jgi:cytochrome P450